MRFTIREWSCIFILTSLIITSPSEAAIIAVPLATVSAGFLGALGLLGAAGIGENCTLLLICKINF